MPAHPIDRRGQKFGRLLVIRYLGNKLWECKCDCGTTTTSCGSDLRRGFKQSCGCLLRESSRLRMTTHGMSYIPEYRVWSAMLDRCEAPNDVGFKNYGARGISVCDRWHKFSAFIEDMGRRPSPKHSLDRKNNNGNYEPSNCRWVTRGEQNSNRRCNHYVTLGGETKTVAEWSRSSGIGESQIRYRLRAGWSVKDAVTVPAENGRTILPRRNMRGEQNPSCIISDEIVRKARRLCSMGEMYYAEIAAVLGVNAKWVEAVAKGRTRLDAGGPLSIERKSNSRYSRGA